MFDTKSMDCTWCKNVAGEGDTSLSMAVLSCDRLLLVWPALDWVFREIMSPHRSRQVVCLWRPTFAEVFLFYNVPFRQKPSNHMITDVPFRSEHYTHWVVYLCVGRGTYDMLARRVRIWSVIHETDAASLWISLTAVRAASAWDRYPSVVKQPKYRRLDHDLLLAPCCINLPTLKYYRSQASVVI